MSLPLLSVVAGDDEDAEEHVMAMERVTISEANLSALSTNDLEQLAQLSRELYSSSTDREEVAVTRDVATAEAVPEMCAEEIEIDAESSPTSEVVPEMKPKSLLPPLRPLNIAPKPVKIMQTCKQPIAGQPLLLLPGNQQLKLVTYQGAGSNLGANISLAKPLQIRSAGKSSIPSSNVAMLQPKQVLMRKIAGAQPQKLLAGETNKANATNTLRQNQEGVISSPTKTITLAQAQELGLLSCTTKLISQVSPKSTAAVLLNKSQGKTVKLVTQNKQHAKILPAPQMNVGKSPQRIVLKAANSSGSAGAGGGQIIHVTDTQTFHGGQLHQINIPGKGIQYIKIVSPTTSNAESANGTGTASATKLSTQIVNIANKLPLLSTVATTAKTSNVVLGSEAIGAKSFKSNSSSSSNTTTTANNNNNSGDIGRSVAVASAIQVPSSGQFVMLPATYLAQSIQSAKVPIPQKVTLPKASVVAETTANAGQVVQHVPPDLNLESNGMRPRKPCNCTKSQCLKLYCDCFANGEFCHLCNCTNCFNNLESEEHRQRAIKSCLERNPSAFRPKIGKSRDTCGETTVRKHTKGCNCKRSGCLKNYCECYEAKIACSSNCKCLGCRNVEDSMDKKDGIASKEHANTPSHPVCSSPLATKLVGTGRNSQHVRQRRHSNSKHAFSFITDDVIEATNQCLLAIAYEGETNAQDEQATKMQIIEEFGRCLKQIINYSNNRNIFVSTS